MVLGSKLELRRRIHGSRQLLERPNAESLDPIGQMQEKEHRERESNYEFFVLEQNMNESRRPNTVI